MNWVRKMYSLPITNTPGWAKYGPGPMFGMSVGWVNCCSGPLAPSCQHMPMGRSNAWVHRMVFAMSFPAWLAMSQPDGSIALDCGIMFTTATRP